LILQNQDNEIVTSAITFFAMRSGETVDEWLKDVIFQAL